MSAQTLLLTLRGPQQAWGSRSRFATRGTERAPTRSGVLGLVAAALGMDRTEPLDRFDDIRFGVRIDRPGRVETDFQTARTLDGKTSMPLSYRAYLADAVFVAGLESTDAALIAELREALSAPRYPLYLGRRAFPPAGPVPADVIDASLLDALHSHPWQGAAKGGRRADRQVVPAALDALVDAASDEQADLSLEDVPVSFDPRRRRYAWRDVRFLSIPTPGVEPEADAAEPGAARWSGVGASAPRRGFAPPAHDPMLLVSDKEV
ncbi:type I-E CRISPR-associated protein Cas5/CasD [Microbacterium sp. No. 7]|uniref:type I-E CRISPR-associated protein Cas5/CasD n=1 Tax=Microbacterium sp. No. 7 TaxID=1714373 RepID=UPI0009EA321D|nr:type I-E CRISPR-associated protein Cas5/CasD [Microbacterium sp. No. 7]